MFYFFKKFILNIVLLWAGWTWMSGLAWILCDLGYKDQIVCLDSTESQLTDKLKKMWLKVLVWKDQYLPKITDHVIYSEACATNNEVVLAKSFERRAKEQRFIWNYFDFLWEISKYFITVGITWTNGKSTATAMMVYLAKNLLKNFSLWILGALVSDLSHQNYCINSQNIHTTKNIFDYILTGKGLEYSNIKKNIFVLEACEYKRHFLKLDIDWWVVTNIELDHTDYYKDIDDYNLAFTQFVDKTKNKVFVVEDIVKLKNDKIRFIKKRNFGFDYIFGEHNNQNWSLVCELLQQLDNTLDTTKIYKKIHEFRWLWRRMEYLWENDKWAKIFSDYGHMASSILLGYRSLKEKFTNKKIVAIFQPHQINRVLREWEDFKKSLKNFDEVIIYNIYTARENLKLELSKFKSFDKKNVLNLFDLWNLFAKECGGKYIEDINLIKKDINKKNNNYVFIIFSAGDLDYFLRNS